LLLATKLLVEKKGSKLIVFHDALPVRFFDVPLVVHHNGREYELSYSNYVAVMNDVLAGVDSLEVSGLPEKYEDEFDGHLNDDANRVVARQVARKIAEIIKK